MNNVQIEQKSYEMPPKDGFTVAHAELRVRDRHLPLAQSGHPGA